MVEIFGKWSVIGKDGRKLICVCECGNKSSILPFDLKSGKTKMCKDCSYAARKGVLRPEVSTHYMADTPTQQVWTDMKRRCLNPSRRGYENYGGRGIKVCSRWLHGEDGKSGFHCFFEDMKERPSKDHQLDRINNDGDYTPENCQWVEKSAQNYNKQNTFRFIVFGEEMTLIEAELKFGINRNTLRQRLTTHKMNPEKAVTMPLKRSSKD